MQDIIILVMVISGFLCCYVCEMYLAFVNDAQDEFSRKIGVSERTWSR